MDAPASIIDLRKLLTSRFPHLRLTLGPKRPAELLATGVPGLDALLGGGLPRGAFTELVASSTGSGTAEVIHEVLRRVALNRQFLALVDGLGSFDVGAVASSILPRLLWVRCHNVTEALKATDLLLRDRNFAVLVLDLKLNANRELRKLNDSVWHRYARLLEQNQATVLVLTPQPLVGAASLRVQLESTLGVDALVQPRASLLARLRFTLLKSTAELNRDQAKRNAELRQVLECASPLALWILRQPGCWQQERKAIPMDRDNPARRCRARRAAVWFMVAIRFNKRAGSA